MTIQEAKQIRIADYLQSLGYTPVTQQDNSLWYKSPLREEAEASFKVNNELNLWYNFGIGKGGNIIALAQELYSSYHVPFLLDNDEAGRKAYRDLGIEFAGCIRNFSHNYHGYKDLNDYLCGKRQKQEATISPLPKNKSKFPQKRTVYMTSGSGCTSSCKHDS